MRLSKIRKISEEGLSSFAPGETGGFIRGKLLSPEALEALARDSGSRMARTRRSARRGGRAFHRRLRGDAARLRAAYTAFSEDARRGLALPPAAEWLVDNIHLVDAQIRDVRRNMPAAFFNQLPCADERGPQPVRTLVLARTLLDCSDFRLDQARLLRFLDAFQTQAVLTLGELWAWPVLLQAALIERLAAVAGEILLHRQARIDADLLVARLEKQGDEGEGIPLPQALPSGFVARLLQRLRELGHRGRALRTRLDDRLRQLHLTVEDTIRAEHQEQAGAHASMENAVTSLRLCSTLDWTEVCERVSLVDQVLRQDPAGVYARLDFASRDRYRHAVEDLAPRSGEAQVKVARLAVDLARRPADGASGDPAAGHVGFYLIGKGRPELEREALSRVPLPKRLLRGLFRRLPALHLGAVLAGTAAAAAAAAWAVGGGAWAWIAALLVLGPASDFVVAALQFLAARLVPPRRLPRLDLSTGVPEEGRTMVVVPTLLRDVADTRDLVDHLEVLALANEDPRVHFAILSDFLDGDQERLPGDDALLEEARSGIRALNARHGGRRFYLFHRARRWNPVEGRWMGWERKRGKLEEFNRLLRGASDTSFTELEGDLSRLPSIRFCLTLDRDTVLPRDGARQLIGILLHPLHRARLDPQTRRVVDGYAILQPRVSLSLASAAASRFARIHSGNVGVDPYTTAVSDYYQDLFGEGLFTGKGLYDVDAFSAALENRVPENALLSHDLFESLFARTALVSDVEVVDDFPANALAHARRMHRWARGDWQLLPWLAPRVPSARDREPNRLPALARWKIFDNLRRSLVPPATLALLAAAWTVLPGNPLLWTAAALAPLLFPVVTGLCGWVLRPARSPDDALSTLGQLVVALLLLPFHAARLLHAAALTLVRLRTRRHMLEWETAASVALRLAGLHDRRGVRRYAVEMAAGPVTGLVVLALAAVLRPEALPAAVPLGLLWIASPWLAWWLGLPPVDPRTEASDDDRRLFRLVARRTWAYFEIAVDDSGHHLPPDNLQEGRVPEVAHRTSPTNVGLYLLGALAARDFGWTSTGEMADRLERAFDTLDRLERYRGHWLNWYDTATLAPLRPRYVSTVDSGNLAGALVALAQGLSSLARGEGAEAPLSAGLLDTLAAAPPRLREETAALEPALREGRPPAPGAEARFREIAERLSPLDPAAARWARLVADQIRRSLRPDGVERDRLAALARRAAGYADAMDFTFLYHDDRNLFTIGYCLPEDHSPGRCDLSYYDLLASEARLASFLAVARRQVPQAHWFRLGRQLVGTGGLPVLVSWSASMFEYLMPALLTRLFPGTLLEESCRRAVRHQIRFGTSHRVPWGVSEAAFNFRDRRGDYQYRAFGVPGLGLKRGLGEDLVVAPYATALAALVEPAEAAANLRRLEGEGAFGPLGFYESLDFTTRRAGEGRCAVVRAHFSHHQGMILVALHHALTGGRMVDRFHADPRVRATEMLLQERAARPVNLTQPRPAEQSFAVPEPPAEAVRRFLSPHVVHPQAQILSNGRWVSIVSVAGGGSCSWRGLSVTPRRDDRTRDPGGLYLYLRDVRTGRVWSPTYHPVDREPTDYEAVFELDRVTFRCREEGLESRLEVIVSPEDDVEVRRLSLANFGDRPREIEVTSYAEIVLARPGEDLAHPVFGKLFLETEFLPRDAALLCGRRPRSAGEPGAWAVHVLSREKGALGALEWESDRARFIGRGRDVSRPAAVDGRPLTGRTGAVLDPAACLRVRLRLEPGQVSQVSFTTGAASSREGAVALAERYSDPAGVERTFALAGAATQMDLHQLGLTPREAQLFMRLGGHVFHGDASLRAPSEIKARNTLGQPGLWRFGLSGDRPIVLVHAAEEQHLRLVKSVVRAQAFWRLKGLRADV
ncbi:MAG TPA: glucoamylase family protein, partial [Planctomycetota bacterium]|nr:glucoamylase family protein [Planctomycetota bacterium]